MLGAGIKTTADIEITLNLNKTKAWNDMKASVKELKASLNDLAKTVGIEQGVKNYAQLERELKKVQAELTKTKALVKEGGDEQEESANDAKAAVAKLDAEYDSLNKSIEQSSKMAIQALEKLEKEEKDSANALISGKKKSLAEQLSASKKEVAATNLRLTAESKLARQRTENAMQSKSAWDKEFRALNQIISAREKSEKAEERRARANLLLLQRQQRQRDALASKQQRQIELDKKEKDAKDRLDASMKTLTGRISFYEKSMDAVFRASFRLKMAGSDLTFMARRAYTAISDMMSDYGEFEFMLNRAAGALSVSNDMIGMMETKVLDLSTQLRLFPAEEVAQALYFWGSTTGQVVKTQQDLENTMKALNPIMKAAAMTNTNYEDTIKGVYSILAQYYNGAISRTKEVTEQLFMVTQKTAAEFPDLINSFKMVGPIAKANNVSFGEMVDLFGRLADLGVRGSMAGRAFRQLFIQMLRPSGPASKAIENLFEATKNSVKEFGGKSYFELMFPKGEFIGVAGYLKNLALATRSLTSAERNSFLAKIATANELPVLTALVNDQIRALKGLTSEQDKNKSSAEEASIYFQQNWDKLQNSWMGTVGALKSTFEALRLQVASVMSDVLTPIVNDVTKVVNAFRDWAKATENRALIEFLGKLAIVGTLATAAVGAILTLIGSLLGLGAAIIIAIRSFSRFIPLIGGIITAVITLADAFVRNFDLIKETVEYAVDTISSALQSSGTAFEDLADIVNSITEPIRGFMDVVIKGMMFIIRSSADLIATLSKANALIPILKIVGGLLAAMFAARAITAIMGMSKAIAVFVLRATGIARVARSMKAAEAGITSIGTAIKSLGSAIGPGGLATLLLGASFIAYDTNFFGFADGINKLTDSFRDLKKEIKESSSEFGSSSVDMQQDAKNFADAWAKIKKVDILDSQTTAETGLKYGVTFADDSYGAFGTMAEAMAVNERLAEKKVLAILDEWKAMVVKVNENVAKYTTGMEYSPVDAGIVIDKLFPFLSAENQKASLEIAATDILTGQALGQSLESIFNSLAPRVAEIQKMGLEKFISLFGENKSVTRNMLDKQQEMRDAMFLPYIKFIDKAIGSGATESEVVDMLMKPTQVAVGGMLLNVGPSVAELGSTLGEIPTAYVEGILEYINKDSLDTLTELPQWENILKEQWAPITNSIAISISNGMQSAMSQSMMLITNDLESIAARLPYANQGAAKGIGSTFLSMIDKMIEGNIIVPDFAKETIRSIADYLRTTGGLDATGYAEMEKALKIGMSEISEGVQKTWEESVADFAANLDLRKGFKEAFKNTKKLGTNAKQMTKILQQFIRGDLKKALRGNLQSQALGKELLDNSIDAVMGGLEATKGLNQQNLAKRVGSFIINKWKNMPAAAKVRWQPVLKWLLSGEVKLPPNMVEKLTGKVNKEVDAAVQDVIKSVTGGNTPVGERIGQELEANPITGKRDSGTTVAISFTPDITMNPVPAATMSAAVSTAIGEPLQIAVDELSPDATAAGKAAISSFQSGASEQVTVVQPSIEGYAKAAIANMNSAAVKAVASSKGYSVGTSFGKGISEGIYSWSDGNAGSTPTEAINYMKSKLNQTQSVKNGGYAVGKSWAEGFRDGVLVQTNALLVNFSATVIGNSPPPEGPLKNIDKGGFNIGHAWAEGITTGAEKEMHRGMKRVRSQMNSKEISGNMGVETTINRKKQIDININVNGSGKVDRETQSAMRKAVYDSLVDSEILDHMVTIN